MPFAIVGGALGIGAGGAAALVGAAGAIGGSLISSSGAQSAAQTQANAANNANATTLSMFNQTQANEKPFLTAGNTALQALMYGEGLGSPTATQPAQTGSVTTGSPATGNFGVGGYGGMGGLPAYLQSLYGASNPATAAATTGQPAGGANIGYGSLSAPFNPANLAQTPGYQFTLGQGEQAIEDAASATGGVGGGNTLKALMGYGQGLASTTYQQQLQDYMAQQQQQYTNLQTIAGSGQNAASDLGSLSGQAAQTIGNNTIGAANSISAGQVASSNAIGGAFNSLGSNFLLSQALNRGNLYNPFGGGSTASGGYGVAEPI